MTCRAALLLAALLGAPLLVPPDASGQAACATGKIAVVQTRAVFASIDSFAVRDTALSVVLNAYKVDLSQLQGVMDSASGAFREKAALLSAAAQQVERKKLDDQDAQIQQRIQVLQQHVAQQRAFLLQPIEIGVQKVIDSIRIELKCAVILDVSSAAGIASVNKSLDLTQRVIDRIQATGDTTLFGPHPLTTRRP